MQIAWRQPTLHRVRHFQSKLLRQHQNRLPYKAVVVDQQPCLSVAEPVHLLHAALHIVEITDEIRQDDDVEQFVRLSRQIVCISNAELQVRILVLRVLHHAMADVDADTIGWLQRIQQFTGA